MYFPVFSANDVGTRRATSFIIDERDVPEIVRHGFNRKTVRPRLSAVFGKKKKSAKNLLRPILFPITEVNLPLTPNWRYGFASTAHAHVYRQRYIEFGYIHFLSAVRCPVNFIANKQPSGLRIDKVNATDVAHDRNIFPFPSFSPVYRLEQYALIAGNPTFSISEEKTLLREN